VAWDDTRNGNDQNGNQDIYFTRVRYAPAAEVFAVASAGSGMSPWVAGFLGAAVAVALGGLIVVIGAQNLRSRKGADEAAPAPPVREPSVT
jgi:hypothetical protein